MKKLNMKTIEQSRDKINALLSKEQNKKSKQEIELNLLVFIYCILKKPEMVIDAKYIWNGRIYEEAVRAYRDNVFFHHIFDTLKYGFQELFENE